MSFCAQIIRATRTRRATRVSPSAVVMTCRSMEPVPEDVTTPRSADCLSLTNQSESSALLTLWCSLVRWRICTWLRSSLRRRWTARPQTEGFPSSPGRRSTARPIRVFLRSTTSASSWCSRSSSTPEDHGMLLSWFSVQSALKQSESVESLFILSHKIRVKLYCCHLTLSPGLFTSLSID